MARTGLGPWKIVLAKGSSSHPGWIMHTMTWPVGTLMIVLASPGEWVIRVWAIEDLLYIQWTILNIIDDIKLDGKFYWFKKGEYLLLSYTYTSIALDTRLLAQTYRPSQIELSSPGIQKSCRGLIRGLIPGLIFFCPALPSSCSRPVEKKTGNICKTI